MRSIYRIVIFLIRAYMRVFFHYRIINKDKLKEVEGCIVAANHISANDPPFIGAILPVEINTLAKKELFKIPLFARVLRFFNAIPIKRGTIDRQALLEAEKKLIAGQSLLIFPEGTRKSVRVKAGIGMIAMHTGKSIIPVQISNSDKFWDCFLGRKRVIITIGDKIELSDFKDLTDSKDDYRRIADHVMEKINELAYDNKNS